MPLVDPTDPDAIERVLLEGTDWVDVKRVLSRGDLRKIAAAGLEGGTYQPLTNSFSDVPAEKMVERQGFTRFEVAIVDWSMRYAATMRVRNDDGDIVTIPHPHAGEIVPINPETIRTLRPQDYDAIDEMLDKLNPLLGAAELKA